jgi:hypothetical protein
MKLTAGHWVAAILLTGVISYVLLPELYYAATGRPLTAKQLGL